MTIKDTLPSARQMVPALIEALAELGLEAAVRELEEIVARKLALTADQLGVVHDKSRSEFQYRFAWSRTYAKREGLVTSERRNRWELASDTAGA